MEVSVSFTDGSEAQDLSIYNEDSSALGRVYINRESVLQTGPGGVRYEKHPWIEAFELDGVRAAPARRTGIGTKGAKGFVKSLSTIYAPAYDEYREYGGDGSFDAGAYFVHAAEHFLDLAGNASPDKLFRRFCGFTENMWREGDEEMYHIAMDKILPVIGSDPAAYERFVQEITDEFRTYIADSRGTVNN